MASNTDPSVEEYIDNIVKSGEFEYDFDDLCGTFPIDPLTSLHETDCLSIPTDGRVHTIGTNSTDDMQDINSGTLRKRKPAEPISPELSIAESYDWQQIHVTPSNVIPSFNLSSLSDQESFHNPVSINKFNYIRVPQLPYEHMGLSLPSMESEYPTIFQRPRQTWYGQEDCINQVTHSAANSSHSSSSVITPTYERPFSGYPIPRTNRHRQYHRNSIGLSHHQVQEALQKIRAYEGSNATTLVSPRSSSSSDEVPAANVSTAPFPTTTSSQPVPNLALYAAVIPSKSPNAYNHMNYPREFFETMNSCDRKVLETFLLERCTKDLSISCQYDGANKSPYGMCYLELIGARAISHYFSAKFKSIPDGIYEMTSCEDSTSIQSSSPVPAAATTTSTCTGSNRRFVVSTQFDFTGCKTIALLSDHYNMTLVSHPLHHTLTAYEVHDENHSVLCKIPNIKLIQEVLSPVAKLELEGSATFYINSEMKLYRVEILHHSKAPPPPVISSRLSSSSLTV